MRGVVLLSVLLHLGTPGLGRQTTGADPRDVAVYRSVLAARIKPEVNRFSGGAGAPTPAPVLTFDRTVALCHTPSDHPREMECMDDERTVQVFERQPARMRRLLFDGLLSQGSREELARAFRERNATSQTFPPAGLDGLIVVAPENLDKARKRESRRTVGITSFSLPAYSSDDRALVYGSYVCGGLCGYGWLFLLAERNGSWVVLSTEMLWIS